jgi:myo-inositol 2-dehydrogenase/D-chiro-inositol 1-dehydrogenase
MNTSGLRVGVVGLGRIGALHARTLVQLDTVSSVTLVDADGSRAESLARELGARVVATPEQMVAAGIDALVIAASTPSHAPLLALAARAGGYRAAHEAVRDGHLGTLLVLRAATHDPAPPTSEYIATSGGIFRDLHIHDFDAIRFVTGQDVVEVFATGAVRETEYFGDHGDVDVAVATLRLSGGALAIVSGTRRNPLGYDVRLEVLGTGDSVGVGVDARTPIRSLEPNATSSQGPGYANFLDRFGPAYRDEVTAFADTVRRGGSSPCTLEEARAALRIALAADRSRAERRPVSIEEVA